MLYSHLVTAVNTFELPRASQYHILQKLQTSNLFTIIVLHLHVAPFSRRGRTQWTTQTEEKQYRTLFLGIQGEDAIMVWTQEWVEENSPSVDSSAPVGVGEILKAGE